MFHVRANELICAFPLDKADKFDNRPVLVPSVSIRAENLGDAIEVRRGTWKEGDVFYLMTDALACWFLRRYELRDGDPFGDLNALCDDDAFKEFIGDQRAHRNEDGVKMLKNDDVTLVRCRINPFP